MAAARLCASSCAAPLVAARMLCTSIRGGATSSISSSQASAAGYLGKQRLARRAAGLVLLKVFAPLSAQSAVNGLGQQSVELRALHSGFRFAHHLNSPASPCSAG